MTVPLDLRAVEARLKGATPGPWVIRITPGLPGFVQAPRLSPSDPYDVEVLGEDDTLYPTRGADMEFVAHAPKDVAALLAALREVRAALKITLAALQGAAQEVRYTQRIDETIADGLAVPASVKDEP